jgi:DNA-binding CsgD family transcriptional regulator
MGRLDRLIERIYDGGVSDAAWQDIVPGIVSACRARSAVLLISNQATGQLSFADEFGLGTEYRRAYLEDLRRDDLRFDDLLRQPIGTLRTDSMIPRYDRYLQSRAYRELYSKLGTEHAMGAFLYSDGPRAIGFRLFRSARDGAFAEAELESYRQLMPHLARAFRLRVLSHGSRRQLRALGEAFDLLPWGLLLFARDGGLIAANAPGRAWLEGGQGRRAAAGRQAAQALADHARSGRRQFAAALPEAGLPAVGPPGVSLSGTGEAPAEALRIDVLRPADPWFDGGEPTALVSFALPGATRAPQAAGLLTLLYGLTESEARLAAALAAGETLASHAARQGIGRETARTHLRNAFAKTGTRRQAELVRLVLGGPAALAAAPARRPD